MATATFEVKADADRYPDWLTGKAEFMGKVRLMHKDGQMHEYLTDGNRQFTVTEDRAIRYAKADTVNFTLISES